MVQVWPLKKKTSYNIMVWQWNNRESLIHEWQLDVAAVLRKHRLKQQPQGADWSPVLELLFGLAFVGPKVKCIYAYNFNI
jgi:hypothetical protein